VTARHDPASVTARAMPTARNQRTGLARRPPATGFAAVLEHGRELWLAQAACQEHDPDLFFPISAIGPGRAQTEQAKQVCRSCPVRNPCRDWAMSRAIPYGVWGGLSEHDRATLIRRSAPAQPQGPP
jgi:WhiB family redox-sensing transcriptional regulator